MRLEFVSPPVRNYLEAGGSQILSIRLTWRGKQQMMSLSFFSHCQSIRQRPEARNLVFTKSCKALATILELIHPVGGLKAVESRNSAVFVILEFEN